MLITVIPHGTSFSWEALTYSVGDSFQSGIKIWQIVEIPYGKKNIFWIVAGFEKNFENSSAKNNFEIKSIVSIVSEKPVLSEYQIIMILRISMKYIIPIHKVLVIFLSEPVLARLQKYNFPLQNFSQKNIFTPEYDIFISKDEVISPEKILPFLRDGVVIILPDDIMLERFKIFFWNQKFSHKNIEFFPADTTETRKAQSFIDIVNRKSEIIIWTRRLLQYNLSAYDEIWYLEDSFYGEYFQYPRRILYTDFLAHMVDSEKFSIKIFTSIPKLATLAKFHFFSLHHI